LEDLPNVSCVSRARRRPSNREPGSSNMLLVSNPGLGGLTRRLACEAQEDQHGALQPHHVGWIEAAQPTAELCPRHGRELVDHQGGGICEAVLVRRSHGQANQWCFGRIGREGTHRDRPRGIEQVGLNDHGGTRHSRILGAAGYGPDFAPPHSSPRSDTTSTKARSADSCGLSASARDCRCASWRNPAERTSGTQTCTGRRHPQPLPVEPHLLRSGLS
jgi:hypothetical protein